MQLFITHGNDEGFVSFYIKCDAIFNKSYFFFHKKKNYFFVKYLNSISY